MARLVRHEATKPLKIEPQEKAVFICACGLSQNLPYCDGSHSKCRDETTGTLYTYDSKRQSVVDQQSDPR